MSESAVDAVRALYEAFGRADIPTILAALDEDIQWSAPENLPQGGEFHGRDEVARFFQAIGENWDGLSVEIEDVVSSGDRVVVLSRITGELRSTGEKTGYRSAHVWTMRGDTPTRFAEYVDAPLTLPSARAATA